MNLIVKMFQGETQFCLALVKNGKKYTALRDSYFFLQMKEVRVIRLLICAEALTIFQ